MRAKEILLTVLLVLILAAVPFAVSHGTLQERTIAHYKDLYQPEEYDFLSGLGEDEADGDEGLDFNDGDEEEEDWGIDFGDDE